MKNEQFCTFCT
ncbi:hypothetical protein EC900091_3648, partial [Escherichia coli 90.0091]